MDNQSIIIHSKYLEPIPNVILSAAKDLAEMYILPVSYFFSIQILRFTQNDASVMG